MSKLKRIHLFSRLNSTAYKAMESATVLCKTRGNPYVELVHLINQIIMSENTDFHKIIDFFQLDTAKLSKDLIKSLDELPRGASSITDFSSSIEITVKEAWMTASLVFGKERIRTGHILAALKQTPELSNKLNDISVEFIKINGDILQTKFDEIVKDSIEISESGANTSTATGQSGQLMTNAGTGKGEALQLYTIDMVEQVRTGKIEEIVGRDKEIRKLIDILMRRRQNNPIITGEAGVGKTAAVEGFACRIAKGDVPDCLKGTVLRSLDMGLLQAGASMKGEFENRLKQIIEDVQNSDVPVILFIDEAHTLIGAGGTAGQNDAANLLKPALARGKLRCIAATTWQEYIKYFEKDPALSRRFQNILIEEPDDDNCIRMMRKLSHSLEKYHNVAVTDEALSAAVKLSRRYIPARQLPDKAVSVLDTACARVALSQSSEPESLEYIRRKIDAVKLEIEILQREEKEGADHKDKLIEINKELEKLENEQADINKKYEKEMELAKKYKEIKSKIAEEKDEKKLVKLREEIQSVYKDLIEVQGETPLVLPVVDEQAVSTIISEWTGIPLGRMVKNEIKSVLNLADEMNKRVIGQKHSLDLIAKRITTAKANLADPEKPQAVFMLAGPSGVGKTETALTIAELVYGSQQNIITINMSEFQEAHTVSTLKGAPPGYVGYGEGGVLTEAVRKKPYSVILLDEVEKAHKDVHEIFFQVFDKGRMEDGAGRLVNFKNTIIILTTNAGDEEIMDLCTDEENYPTAELLEKAVRPALMKVFPAALLGRLSVIPYYPLSTKALHSIIDLKLNKVVKRIKENYNAEMVYDEALRNEIVSRCDNIASGARLIDAVINNDLLPDISAEFLRNTMEGKVMKSINVSVKDGSFIYNYTFKED